MHALPLVYQGQIFQTEQARDADRQFFISDDCDKQVSGSLNKPFQQQCNSEYVRCTKKLVRKESYWEPAFRSYNFRRMIRIGA